MEIAELCMANKRFDRAYFLKACGYPANPA
jgi:hypothetical protein